MAASRSRTDRWRECLDQIAARGGGLEFAIARPDAPRAEIDALAHAPRGDAGGGDAGAGDAGVGAESDALPGVSDLVWRVRVAATRDQEIIAERPTVLGRPVDLTPGTELVCVMSLGQNRWMFRSRVLPNRPGEQATVRLAVPEQVERCQRRSFLRVSMAEMSPPNVRCWPLSDPSGAALSQAACREAIRAAHHAGGQLTSGGEIPMPEVGPGFPAQLMNLGGGGAGLLVTREHASALDRSRLLFMRLDLRPGVPAPLFVTARVAHTHIDSAMSVHAGIAFEFALDPDHRDFVVNEICRVVNAVQARQRRAA